MSTVKGPVLRLILPVATYMQPQLAKSEIYEGSISGYWVSIYREYLGAVVTNNLVFGVHCSILAAHTDS